MKVNNIRNIKPSNKMYRKVIAVTISIAVIAVSYAVLNGSNKSARDTVEVVRVNTSGGISAQTLIKKSCLEKYSIIRKEYSEDMILYQDINKVTGKYSSYYLRNRTILYKDQVTAEIPVKNAWLNKLDKASEILTLPYNYMECGGDILRPGDNVRVRVTSMAGASSPAASTVSLSRFGAVENLGDSRVVKTDVLFESIKVKDLLNSSGHSIYEVYREVLKLDKEKKEAAMASDEFLRNIQPRSLVLEATPQQVTKYANFKTEDGRTFTITILSRDGNRDVIDQLPTIEKEVESWGAQKEN